MLRIVLPIASAARRLLARPVAIAYVLTIAVADVLPVGIPDEVIVVVDVDVVITAAPTATTAPTSTAPEGSHSHADPERDRHPRGVVAGRRIRDGRIGIHWSAVNHGRVVAGDVDHLWTGLLDDDNLLAFDCLDFDLLLFGRFQVAVALGLLAHTLHRSHHVILLREEGVSQVRCPLDVL